MLSVITEAVYVVLYLCAIVAGSAWWLTITPA